MTLAKINDINDRGIYPDLLRKFRDEGHDVTIVCPNERKYNLRTQFIDVKGVKILKVWTTNIQKTSTIEKGITTLFIEHLFLFAINKYIRVFNFDLIIYSTPPITFTNIIKKIKKKSKATTYLLLKDIFPQNAVDLGMIKLNGILYKYFKHKEKMLYAISDYIGCMSPANLEYILKNNFEINVNKIEVNPNSVDVLKVIEAPNIDFYKKYNIPTNKILFLFGGNLGLPQGVEFLKQNVEFCKTIKGAFFLVVGDGTEFENISKWVNSTSLNNLILIKEIPACEYNALLKIVHVGLIFLNPAFTIPNFPSRLLSYMQFKIPIISATDEATDIGDIAQENNFGFKCHTNDKIKFYHFVKLLLDYDLRNKMGENAYNYLIKEYDVKITYQKIIQKI